MRRLECVTTGSNGQRHGIIRRKANPANVSSTAKDAAVRVEEHSFPIASLGFAQASDSENRHECINSLTDFHNFHHIVLDRLIDGDEQPTSTPSINTRDARIRVRTPNKPTGARSLDLSEVEAYVQKFVRLKQNIPFVSLPESWTVHSLRKERPFLLLSILAAMTIHETSLNSHLHTQFLNVLAQRAVVRGERSLEVVQGILVQVAWSISHSINYLPRACR